MRSLSGLTGIIMLVATSTALAEVKAREVPMRWQQAAISDGWRTLWRALRGLSRQEW